MQNKHSSLFLDGQLAQAECKCMLNQDPSPKNFFYLFSVFVFCVFSKLNLSENIHFSNAPLDLYKNPYYTANLCRFEFPFVSDNNNNNNNNHFLFVHSFRFGQILLHSNPLSQIWPVSIAPTIFGALFFATFLFHLLEHT